MTENNDEFMILLSEVEKSSEEITEIMQNLSSIQALEGNRELENLIGISHAPCSLKREVERTKELLSLNVTHTGLELTVSPRLVSSLQSSCLSLQRAGITGMYHHTQLFHVNS
uniref:Centromere protein R isoform X1 n=1 Tax=Castor canadensis TaxID=51338 RepID=A0A8B7TVG9_CASCN|nr:centromere protein R isoform X1 [Castor canadensis]